MRFNLPKNSESELSSLARLITQTGILPDEINFGKLRIKLHIHPKIVAVRPPIDHEPFRGLIGLIRPKRRKIMGLGITRHVTLKILSDPRRISSKREYIEATVVIFEEAHGWQNSRALQEACERAVLEGKTVIVRGDRHIGKTVASIMSIADDPQILTQPCTHIDKEGWICGEPAYLIQNKQPRCRRHFTGLEAKIGGIELIVGPPGAGKTANAKLRYLFSLEEKVPTLLVTARGTESRAGLEFSLDEAVHVENYEELLRVIEAGHKRVIIDEGTLITDLGNNARKLADERSLELIIYGRPTDARGEAEVPHRETVPLMIAADKVVAMPAICTVCGRLAMRSQYLLREKPVRFFDTFRLRRTKKGKELQPRCRACHKVEAVPETFRDEGDEAPRFLELFQDARDHINLRHPSSIIFAGSVVLLSILAAIFRKRRKG